MKYADAEWKDVPEVVKIQIRDKAFNWLSVYDRFEDLPESVREGLPRKAYNPRLMGKHGAIFPEEKDLANVLSRYVYTMNHAAHVDKLLSVARPVINSYQGDTHFMSVRGYLIKQVQAFMKTPTIGEKLAKSAINEINSTLRTTFLDPKVLTNLSAMARGRAQAGLLGPATAVKKILHQQLNAWVDGGNKPFLKAWKEYVVGGGVKENVGDAWDYYGMQSKLALLDVPEYKLRKTNVRGAPRSAEGAYGMSREALIRTYQALDKIALSPLTLSLNMDRGIHTLAALAEAHEQGIPFDRAYRMNVVKISDTMPDLFTSQSIHDAILKSVSGQYSFDVSSRSPLLRGPFAALGTLFWSFPIKTSQYLWRGIAESMMGGDDARLARFVAYTGAHIGVTIGALKLGIDLAPVFAHALIPANFSSFGLDVLKNVYNSIDPFSNKTIREKQDARDTLKESALITTIPGYYGWGHKMAGAVESSFTGTKKAYKSDYAEFETTPMEAWLDAFGIRWDKHGKIKAILAEQRQVTADENYKKDEVKKEAADLYERGLFDKFNQVIVEARNKGVPIRPHEVVLYSQKRTRMSYLQMNLKKMRKDLQPQFQAEVDALQAELFPRKTATGSSKPQRGNRPMWGSGTTRFSQLEAEEEQNAPTEL
jgi:hypothetical protein